MEDAAFRSGRLRPPDAPTHTALAEDSLSHTYIEWEEVNCLLCGGPHSQILLEAPDRAPDSHGLRFAVVRCDDCGLCFTNPRPNRDTIGQFYPTSYRPHRSATKLSRKRWQRRYPALPRWLARKHQSSPFNERGRLLDFGCGGGLFLEQMRQFGWQVIGIDTSYHTVERLRCEQGLNAYLGSLPHPGLSLKSFDVITMWHSLEHVHHPKEVLKGARDLLAPGGKLIVAVPNIESLPFRWFGPAWYGLDLPRHLIHFSPRSLQALLHLCGLHVEDLRMVRHSSWLRASAKFASQHYPTFWNRFYQAKSASRLLSWYNYFSKQSDCIMATALRR